MHGYDKKYKLKFKNLAEKDHCVNTDLYIQYLFHCSFMFVQLFILFTKMPVLVAIKETGLEENMEKTKNVFRNSRL